MAFLIMSTTKQMDSAIATGRMSKLRIFILQKLPQENDRSSETEKRCTERLPIVLRETLEQSTS